MQDQPLLYFMIYKPFGMLSQFTPEDGHTSLADLAYPFPKDVYPVGRLDADSEGLLILTNDKRLNNLLLDPKYRHKRSYLVQVEGVMSEAQSKTLSDGPVISLKEGSYKTLPTEILILETPPELPERNPPIRFRKNVPDTWIKLTLTEGKNRQVRKMTAAAGCPTLRLVRYSIEKLSLQGLKAGEVRSLSRSETYQMLQI